MATLYKRLTNPDTNSGDVKIPIHGFRELLFEFYRGNVTQAQVVSALDLDGPQTTDATTIYTAITGAPNKLAFLDELFGKLVLAELGILPSVYNETNFWTWVNS